MSASSIIQRLILLVTVPLVALVILAGMLIIQSFSTYRNSVQTHQLMGVIVSAGNLIHTLQIERGATAGFLQSNGQKFADVLPDRRSKTDDRLNAFRKQIDEMSANDFPLFAKSLANSQDHLKKLDDIRQHANQFTLSVPEEVAYYSGAITHLINAMSAGIEINRDATISQKMIAYLSFVRAKENAGQERALVTAAFSANHTEPEQYRTILAKFNQQDAYLNDFFSIAGEEEKQSLQAVLSGPANKEVMRFREILITKSAEGGFGVEPTEWFKTITAKIDGLHETESLISSKIDADGTKLLQASRSKFIIVLTFGILALVLTITISLWVAKGISTPLREMVIFAEKTIAENDFTGKAPERGASEVMRTGKALNLLVGKFRNVILDTKQSSDQISNAAHSLALSSNEVTESSHVQSSAAESVAAAVEQSSVSISETATNARAASEVVARSRENSEKAKIVMRDTVSNMNGVAQLIRDSGNNVHYLSESSQKIGHIVQVIRDIAEQTNLLALNAAIEAARAGDQGRGFAVVADEVRKLAERTAVATGEIATLIKNIQENIGGTVIAMEQANLQATASLNLVNQSEQAMHQIDDDSQEAANNVQSISDALSEQDVAIRQIAVNVEQIAQMTESNNNSAAANNITASVLDGLASQLRNSVLAFRV